jgi:hypothetical protein
MGLNVYYPQDIRNALLAAEQAVNATADAAGDQDDPFTAGFLAGYRAALATVALAFGLVRPGDLAVGSPTCTLSRRFGLLNDLGLGDGPGD